jgi:hypothetical protein
VRNAFYNNKNHNIKVLKVDFETLGNFSKLFAVVLIQNLFGYLTEHI